MSIFQAASNKTDPLATLEKRLHLEHLLNPKVISESEENDGKEVVWGLTQTPKRLPPRYFYDDRGSLLFEQICELPEYYLTRTETAILQDCAGEIARLTGACEIVELGSGSSTKTRILLDAYQQLNYPLLYVPIDVSAGILESSAKDLLADYPSLVVRGLVSTYEMALSKLTPSGLPGRMICFLGSTLGNLNPQESDRFFSQITESLNPGEYFLLGIDLQKSPEMLNAAYNDRQGVTAEFNLNMLDHLNWRFDGNFDRSQFEHWAFYNTSQCQIEMHLRSMKQQTVDLRGLSLSISFSQDETIFTEISRKFDLDVIQKQLNSWGLKTVQVWTDPQQWVGLLLCEMSSIK